MTSLRARLVLGSRGSELARAQTRSVQEALKLAWPELETTVELIATRGDERTAEPIDQRAGRKGLFTGELERALEGGKIDVAVHSAKDLPSVTAETLSVGAVLRRGPVEDVLITKNPGGLHSLGRNSTIATGSIRRRCQLGAVVAGIRTIDLRGNVPTRLRKLAGSDWDGLILARAGLLRLGYNLSETKLEFEGREFFYQLLARDSFVPAGGQGIIALQVRAGDQGAREIVEKVNDRQTYICLCAEREFLRLLEGDCNSPVGVHATITEGVMSMSAQVFEPSIDVQRSARTEAKVETGTAEKLAARLLELINGD